MKLRSIKAGLALAAFVCTTLTHAQPSTPPTGEYIYQGGNGALTVKAGNRFEISTVSRSGNVCDVSGTIAQGKASQGACAISFTTRGSQVDVTTNRVDACQEACGMNASFEGSYFKPTAACTTKAVAATRKSFKRQYDARDYAGAESTLAPVLAGCDKTLDEVDKGWIRSDLALAQFRRGDSAACLKTLEPLAEDAGKTDATLREENPPMTADRYVPVVRAARTNLKLCKG